MRIFHLLRFAMAGFALLPVAAGAEPRVVSDLPPVASLVAQVMGDLGTPELLITTGGAGHHHQLRPSEARLVANADLLIWIGPAMTPWLADAAQLLPPDSRLTLFEVPDTHLRSGHEDDDEAHGHGHDHHIIDPHAWLDPANARLWMAAIAETLARIDPANGETYRNNAVTGSARIDAAEAEARGILSDLPARPIVIAHDSLGYFTDAMGLPPALALADHSDSAPSVRALNRLRTAIADSDAQCRHPEPGTSKRSFSSLDGLGLRDGAELDVMGVAQTGGPDAGLYPALLIGLAQAIADCALAK